MMIHVDPSRPTSSIRRACDRCHRSKQKCIRPHNGSSQSCRRCLDADLECVYSPPSRSSTRTGAPAVVATARDGNAAPKAVIYAAALPDASTHVHAPLDAALESDAHKEPRLYLNDNSRLRMLGMNEMSALLSETRPDMDLDEWTPPDNPAVDCSPGSQQPSRSSISPSSLLGGQTTARATSSSTTSNTASTACGSWPVAMTSIPSPPATSVFPSDAEEPASSATEPSPFTPEKVEPKPSGHSGLAEWTRKLADLTCQLTQHLTCIPDLGNNEGSLPAQAEVFAIDTTLNLSKLFIDTLAQLRKEIPPVQRHMATPTATQKPDFSLDASSELLIFSAYLRLLEIYSRVVHHMQTCLYSRRQTEETQDTFSLPDLSIGSFSLSSDSTIQFAFLISLIESMLARAKKLVSEIASPNHTPGYRGNFHCFGGVSLVIVPDLALQAIRTREDMVLKSARELSLLLSPTK